jgi:hypothetical protein
MSWFRRSAPTPPPPPDPAARYRDKPALLVLESYVLDAIGELAPEKREMIGRFVQSAFAGGDDWKATVRQQFNLESTVDDSIRRMWTRNQEIARENRATLTPQDFAVMFVEKNFGHHGE